MKKSTVENARLSIKDEIAQLKHQQILDAAVGLFLQNGYHGTSVDSIANVLGVSKQFIYYQFKDKAAVLNGVCTAGAELTLSAVNANAEAPGQSAAERLRSFSRRLTEIVIDHGGYLAVYASEVASLRDEDRRRILGIRAEVDNKVSYIIEEGIRSGEFRDDDPMVSARAITGMISFMWTWAHPSSPQARATLVEQMIRISLRSVGTTE
ncbi:TetR family transcriptional regulator [Rhodococcus sp. IEGM 1241]|uniref:TetR family transcriptional regulator n=1 Tax=Rhodococcus TaxID=1827 RepID=UPI002955B624|nr:TetR family transcriptional regulator [Rhodococcus sp. IEGM 1241]MDJ0105194.1 TetR family transcriptional regulator [Rhodococcus erythropolis]MDV8015344.1 TetR family transcriptional regulator [Rhodococcus sp. IEGM 1241]